MIKKLNVYKFFIVTALCFALSSIIAMEETKKPIRKMDSLINLTLKTLNKRGIELLQKGDIEYQVWLDALPMQARQLLDNQYPSLNGWIKVMLEKISKGHSKFKNLLEIFDEYTRNQKLTIIHYLLSDLETNWQTFADDDNVNILLNMIFRDTYNINLIPYFRHLLIEVLIDNGNKIIDLMAENPQDELQIGQRKKLNEAFEALSKICEENLIKIDETLMEGIKLGNFILEPSIEVVAKELIFDFESKNFENFKIAFQKLKKEDQKIVLNYIFGIYIPNKKVFSGISEMTNYIDNIINLFKETNKDLSSVLEFMLNFYAKTADYVYSSGSIIMAWYNLSGVKIIFPIFIPKFYLIYTLKNYVLEIEYKECSQLFDSNEMVVLAKKVIEIHHKYDDYRLLKDFISCLFNRLCIFQSEQADKNLVVKFIKFLLSLNEEMILEENFFFDLKHKLLLSVEVALILNKDEVKNMLNESL